MVGFAWMESRRAPEIADRHAPCCLAWQAHARGGATKTRVGGLYRFGPPSRGPNSAQGLVEYGLLRLAAARDPPFEGLTVRRALFCMSTSASLPHLGGVIEQIGRRLIRPCNRGSMHTSL